jgi:hypothetical protein
VKFEPITQYNSIVADSEWWCKDTKPHPCLISYKSNTLPATVTNGLTPLPSGYKYYISWFVGAERTKIPLPEGGQWVCLASLSHCIQFDCISKTENLATIYQRLTGKELDKNVRDRFVDEAEHFTDFTEAIAALERFNSVYK